MCVEEATKKTLQDIEAFSDKMPWPDYLEFLTLVSEGVSELIGGQVFRMDCENNVPDYELDDSDFDDEDNDDHPMAV